MEFGLQFLFLGARAPLEIGHVCRHQDASEL